MAAYSTAIDPIMQRYIELLRTNPALAQQIDERTAELFGQPELNVYNRGLRNVVTPDGGGADAAYREVPRATALRTAVQELDAPGAAATPPVAPVEPTAPAATNGADLAAVDERLRTLNELTGADIPVMRARTPTGRTDAELRQRIKEQAAPPDATPTQSRMGRGRFTLDQPERPDTGFELSPLPDTPSRESRPLGFMRPFPTTPPTQQVKETVEEAPAPAAKPVVETQETPQEDAPAGSILSRIGRYAKENPDIALAGMEGIGNLLANIGAARGQRKADEATQQGMARSNLISALTGGRVRPAVAEETPEMGLLGRVGQAVGTAGKLGREVEQQRAARGFKEEEMQRKYDIKEAEVERKVADDVRKMMLAVGKNKLTDAQAEKVLADITLDMTAEDRKLYTTKWRERAEFAGLLVKQQAQSLAELKWADQKVLQDQGQRLDQAYFDLSKEHKQELWQKWADELKIDEDRVKIDEDRADAYANQVKNEGEKIALQRAGEDRKRRREVMNIVKNNLNGDVLKKFMGSERGAFNTYQGLMAAWRDFESKPTSANMNGVFNMYQQLFDPATVREGDLELQRRGQGAFADAFAAGQRLFGEGFVLEQETIEEMKQVADMYYNDALEKERVKLDSYLEKFVAPEDAASIRAYYNTIWGAPEKAGAGGPATSGNIDTDIENF